MKLLQIDFPFQGPFAEELAQACHELAENIAEAPGLHWKIWTEDAATHRAGGIYLFADQDSAETYLQMHTERLKEFGVNAVRAYIFDVSLELFQITRGPIPTRV